MVEIKFCGLTRAEDAARVAASGGRYAGVIFAGGPREVSPATARAVLAPLDGSDVRRVGVVADQSVGTLQALARSVPLDVIQFSNGVELDSVIGLRTGFAGEVWSVFHVRPDDVGLDGAARAFDQGVDAVLLDTFVPGRLGGSGVAMDWARLGDAVATLRERGRVVLAGGLRAGNVAEAIRAVAPDVVDVSSGVESAPGIKDPQLMRAFGQAVRAHEV